METKFNFNSAICTSKEQSERLLALGLKKETADCALIYKTHDVSGKEIEAEFLGITAELWESDERTTVLFSKQKQIPAWSLARLVELMPESIDYEGNELYLTIYGGDVFYSNLKELTPLARTLDVYEHLIWYIKWLIKEGYFNKEYLV